MLKNNLIVVLLHLFIGIFVFLVYGTPSSYPKYGLYGETLFFIVVLLTYFIFGYLLTGKVLIHQNNTFKSIISISSIFILGLLVWTYKFFASGWWLLEFFIYNYYAVPLYPIFEYFHYDNLFILVDLEVLFSFLPVLLIWAGMEFKYNKTIKLITKKI